MALAGYFCAPLQAQISPGPLSLAHQQLEGVGKCSSCHELGAGERVFKCLNCHGEIKRRVESHSGMHARVYHEAQGQTECARCHMEHNGQGFALIRLDRAKFDHLAQTGFALEGKHRAQKCEACHNAAKQAPGAREEIKLKNPGRSFLGLRRECLSCHQDQHHGQLGADCTRCHTPNAWSPASGFNHSKTHFALTGLHQNLACQKCHVPAPGEKVGAFKAIAVSGCQSCHNDPHKGAFQEVFAERRARAACESCHNTGGWKSNRPGNGFDHTATKFALAGKHAALACAACHKGTDFHRPIAHAKCMDCHKDQHSGQFATRALGSDCASCHSETGFKPTRFDRATHAQSAFPLTGKHAEVKCEKCHPPEGASTVYKSGKLVCSACHADKHGGQFASAPYENRCDRCHTVEGFRPDTFSLERHAATQFPLAGKHTAVACRDCHKPLGESRQFHFAARNCTTCHTDPHQTKLACESCHTVQQWKPAGTYDHSATGFRLEGGHAKPACAQCHRPAGSDGALAAKAPRFADTSKRCSACHAAKDPHAGQFDSSARQEDCSNCHVTARWSGNDFDHDRARFALDVAHRRVACEKCHKQQREVAGKTVRLYRGTAPECVQCH